jgi:hypothetical protein
MLNPTSASGGAPKISNVAQDFFPRIKPLLLHILLIVVVTSWA